MILKGRQKPILIDKPSDEFSRGLVIFRLPEVAQLVEPWGAGSSPAFWIEWVRGEHLWQDNLLMGARPFFIDEIGFLG